MGVRPPSQPHHGGRRLVLGRRRRPCRSARVGRRARAEYRPGGPGAYVNFLEVEEESRIRQAYPGKTWDRLAAVKGRYDPTNLFRMNQIIPPAPLGKRSNRAGFRTPATSEARSRQRTRRRRRVRLSGTIRTTPSDSSRGSSANRSSSHRWTTAAAGGDDASRTHRRAAG